MCSLQMKTDAILNKMIGSILDEGMDIIYRRP